MPDELRRCKDCHELKSPTAFSKLKDGLRPYCRPCAAVRLRAWREKNQDRVKEYDREYKRKYFSNPENVEHKRRYNHDRYHNNPEQHRKTRLVREFGITVEQYDEMLAAQDGKCAICQRSCKSGRKLAVDHCHDTGRVRALLCMNCNRAIGWMDDDVERLTAAIAYILRYRDVLKET